MVFSSARAGFSTWMVSRPLAYETNLWAARKIGGRMSSQGRPAHTLQQRPRKPELKKGSGYRRTSEGRRELSGGESKRSTEGETIPGGLRAGRNQGRHRTGSSRKALRGKRHCTYGRECRAEQHTCTPSSLA
jgi:hypothetical protein